MNEDVIPHTESSTAWRAANSARFPVLAVEAKRYLSAPPTSVTSEHLFSSAAQVLYRQMLSSCAQTSLTKPLTMLLLRQDVKTVVRLACIVRLNDEWNAAFSRP